MSRTNKMKDDRLLLTEQQELIANAVVSGILCYLDPSTGILGPTPVPSETPIQPTSTPGIAPIMTSAPTPTPDA